MASLLNIADLANSIASGVKGLAGSLGLSSLDPKFPEYRDQGITSDFQRGNWYQTPPQGAYAFSVEPVGSGSISEFPAFIDNIKSLFGSFLDDGKFGEFKLPISPQEINQTENFAVVIKPTQGGTVVNRSPSRYKTLTISGTTGVQPYRGLLGTYKGNGVAIGKPDELKYRSGYEVFLHFRNWIRSYSETKAKPGSQPLRMMFRNYKDWEFLYVEPLAFNMRRDASKPLLYNYTIQFKVIGVHTIKKPLFDMAVAKLDDISASVLNAYALVKKNKAATEYFTGVYTDYIQSVNNLKYALKAANKEDLKLAEFTQSDAKKLSFKEALQVLGKVGESMATADETLENPDPATAGLALTTLSKNPSFTNPKAAQAELLQILDTQPELLTKIAIDSVPPSIKQGMLNQQKKAALISALEIASLQQTTVSLSDKLADGLGLGDDTYNSVFGITSTAEATENEITDSQFEMLYALHQIESAIDGVLASDEMFDTNAALFKSPAANGADSVGAGIFSFPAPGGSFKEGFLPDNATLEDLALAELGDASRWTEIAELNNLKSPYIVDRDDVLSPNYRVASLNYSNPTQIRNLQAGDYYVVPGTPTPTGAWLAKSGYIARFNGGDYTDVTTWTFIGPEDGTLVQDVSTLQYFKYTDSDWVEVFEEDYEQDGVLRPGDKLKIPSSAPPPLTTRLYGPRDNRYLNGLSNAERSLSVDLRLTDQMDLDLTPSGDLNVAYGVDNGVQAIVLKLLYEKGSLKEFPLIGTNLTPGKKMPDIATLRADLLASLLQDTRIKDVRKINLNQESSTVNLSFEVIFNDVQEPVTFNIPV